MNFLQTMGLERPEISIVFLFSRRRFSQAICRVLSCSAMSTSSPDLRLFAVIQDFGKVTVNVSTPCLIRRRFICCFSKSLIYKDTGFVIMNIQLFSYILYIEKEYMLEFLGP